MHSKSLPTYCIPGRRLEAVDGAILHYFSAKNVDPDNRFNLEVCRNLLLDLNRPREHRQRYMLTDNWPEGRMYASAHLLIGREGEVWRLVEYDQQAYHAGASYLNGRQQCNRWTLGIELLGDHESGFSRAQYVALADLLVDLEAEFNFSRENVAGHDFVRWAAIARGSTKRPKYDPSGRKDGRGDNFDWFYLGKLWNDREPNPAGVVGVEQLDTVLAADPLSQ